MHPEKEDGRGVQRSCPVSCQQQCECEWRSRLCECELRFIELEYEHRLSSRIKNYLSLDSLIAPMQQATCLPTVRARTLSHGNSTILWKAET
nr:MAG TPA: DBF DBF zinc finger [Caudoviricetes sp.]